MADVEDSMALLEEGLSSSSMSSSSDLSSDEADPALSFGPDLFIDDEDREKLMAMPELQREEILLKRKEMLDKSKERREAQAKWRLEQRRQRRERMEETEAPASTRAKRQKKSETGKEKAIQDIRGRRNKQIRARQSEIVREHYSEDEEEWQDAEDDEAEEYRDDVRDEEPRDRRTMLSPSRDAALDPLQIRSDANNPINWETMRSVQLRRDRLESLVDEPFFDDVVKGMFCRIGLGTNDTTGEHVYRAVMIVNVTEYPRTYTCGTKETSKALRVSFGASEKTFKISQVSNHGLNKNEAGQWIRAQQNDGLAVPTVGQCIATKLAAERLWRTFEYTQETIDEMVQRKKSLRAGKSHNMTQQKLLLQRELQLAIETGDTKRQSEIESRLDSMIEYILTLKRRQDNTVEVLNQKIRQANKLLDMKSDLANLRVEQAQPIVRPQLASRQASVVGGDQNNAAPACLEYKFMNQALKKLAKAHNIALRIDVRAPPPTTARKSVYLDLHPQSARLPPQFDTRHQFSKILTIPEWRAFKGLQ